MSTELVVRETFTKSHKNIRENLLTRVQEFLSNPELRLKKLNTEEGYAGSVEETISLTDDKDNSIFICLRTSGS